MDGGIVDGHLERRRRGGFYNYSAWEGVEWMQIIRKPADISIRLFQLIGCDALLIMVMLIITW